MVACVTMDILEQLSPLSMQLDTSATVRRNDTSINFSQLWITISIAITTLGKLLLWNHQIEKIRFCCRQERHRREIQIYIFAIALKDVFKL